MREHDVVVVGAGPAGSVAALVLARAGLRVQILDRARFPREKLCGDTLNPGALARLDRLGLGEALRARSLPVAGMLVTGPRGARAVGMYPHGIGGVSIARRTLDMLLLDAAIRAGARFEPEVEVRGPLFAGADRVAGVRVATRSGEARLPARVVIAADGRASRLAFGLGLARYAPRPRRWAFGTYYTDVDGLTSCGEMHIREGAYVGVAPLPNGLTNVCVVREMEPAGHAARAPGEGAIARALAADPMLCDRFVRARPAGPVAVLGPLAVDARAAGRPGLLLAGDAAGFIDPMTGDGLRFAIRGAELAAACAIRDFETGLPMHDELAIARRREFASKWRMNRLLRALVASSRAVHAAATVAKIWDTPVRALIARAGDVDSAAARAGSGARAR